MLNLPSQWTNIHTHNVVYKVQHSLFKMMALTQSYYYFVDTTTSQFQESFKQVIVLLYTNFKNYQNLEFIQRKIKSPTYSFCFGCRRFLTFLYSPSPLHTYTHTYEVYTTIQVTIQYSELRSHYSLYRLQSTIIITRV